MCFGQTYVCQVCGKIEYSIIPAEHCGEPQPFPEWHHVTGYTDRSKTCYHCIRREERALVEESHQIARQHESKFAMKAFLHGERDTHLTDQELRERSRDILMAYSRGERLHPFGEQHISLARQTIEEEMESLSMQIRAGLLDRFDDMVRRQSEINTTGRAITEVDRINSYDAIQNQMEFDVALVRIHVNAEASEPRRRSRSPPRQRRPPGPWMARRSRGPPQSSPGRRVSPTRELLESGMSRRRSRSPHRHRTHRRQRTPAPRGFNSFVRRYYEENPRPANEAADLAPEAILQVDVEHYIENLAAGREIFGPEHLDRFQELFFNTRTRDMRNFDFVPVPNPGGLVVTFRQWLNSEPIRATVIQEEGDRSINAWLEAIYLYATYLRDGLAPLPEHLEAFVRVRRELADSERRLYDEFRPSRFVRSRDSESTSIGTGVPEVLLTFQEWVRRDNGDPSVVRSELPGTALTQDMDGYERYLHHQATGSELNDFQILRASITNTALQYAPVLSHIPSLLAFLNERNESRRLRGEVHLSAPDIVGDYARSVLHNPRYEVPPEVFLDFDVNVTQYFEENRRQMYGYPRNSFSPLVELLRQSRNVVRDLVYASVEYWPLSPQNPVILATMVVRSFLRRCISTEQNPTPDSWRRIGEDLAQAQTIDREEGERRSEAFVNDIARNPIPRTPETVDEDASTVTSSPPQRQPRFPPPGVPHFPFDLDSDSDDDFPL